VSAGGKAWLLVEGVAIASWRRSNLDVAAERRPRPNLGLALRRRYEQEMPLRVSKSPEKIKVN
jgi:hypothetical protein